MSIDILTSKERSVFKTGASSALSSLRMLVPKNDKPNSDKLSWSAEQKLLNSSDFHQEGVSVVSLALQQKK